MTIRYRRDVLAGTTLLLAGSAGCFGLGESGLAAYDLADREPDCDIFCERADLETKTMRSPERLVEFEADEERGVWPTASNASVEYHDRFLVWGSPFVDELAFADVDGADDAEAFLRETSYDEASALIVQFETDDCQRVEPVEFRWRADGIYVTLCSQLYGYDIDCEAGKREWVTLFARLPEPLNPDDVETFEVTLEDECGGDTNESDDNGDESGDDRDGNGDESAPADGDGAEADDETEAADSEPTETGDGSGEGGNDR